MSENERFGLVFAKTGSLSSATGEIYDVCKKEKIPSLGIKKMREPHQ
jgi:hypothetical protein